MVNTITVLQVVEEYSDAFASVSLRCQQTRSAKFYGGSGSSPTHSVLIARGGECAQAFTVDELMAGANRLGIDLLQWARREPVSVAKATAFIQDQGRLVVDHPLYLELLEEQSDEFTELLPKMSGDELQWHVVLASEGSLQLERKVLRV